MIDKFDLNLNVDSQMTKEIGTGIGKYWYLKEVVPAFFMLVGLLAILLFFYSILDKCGTGVWNCNY